MDLEKAVTSSKRASMCTPERRKLFHDSADEITPSKDKVAAGSPDKKDDKESPPIKPKKAKRPRRAQKTPKSKSNARGSTDKPSEEPAITQPEIEPSQNVEPAEGKDPKVKPPTDRQKTWAEGVLMDAKNDSPSWDHVTKLFEATKKDEREPCPKMHYWGFSMYYLTRRVGILQQQGKGKKVHVMSFGGGQCALTLASRWPHPIWLSGSYLIPKASVQTKLWLHVGFFYVYNVLYPKKNMSPCICSAQCVPYKCMNYQFHVHICPTLHTCIGSRVIQTRESYVFLALSFSCNRTTF